VSDQQWTPWPEVFNAGTVDENEAWVALSAAEDFIETVSAFSAYFRREFVTGYRRCGDSFEFLMPESCGGPRKLVMRAWFDGDEDSVRCTRVEVRRG